MGNDLVGPPVLSTSDTRISEFPATQNIPTRSRSDEELSVVYEIGRTIREIKQARWRHIALQFPDSLLPDAPRVFEILRDGLRNEQAFRDRYERKPAWSGMGVSDLKITEDTPPPPPLQQEDTPLSQALQQEEERLYILGDTSYGACCVDEIAAEHVDADVVVHYGRACLSPTARLPVIHVFTIQELPLDPVLQAFAHTYPELHTRVILTADVTFASHLPALKHALDGLGYWNIYVATIKHDPSSPIPNRTVPPETAGDPAELYKWSIFHISSPPPALLLTLHSRFYFIHIYPTDNVSEPTQPLLVSSAIALRRRYALLTRISRASIIGILINTLSVHAYQDALAGAEARIAAAGKKSYVFAMGRLNAAKVANFAEVDGWVVIGCWESSLVESTEFEKPVVTPFELELALQGDEQRVWTGEWRGDFGSMLEMKDSSAANSGAAKLGSAEPSNGENELDSEEESEPPEFDLRTGRYISHSRPMRRSLKPAKAAADNGENGTDDNNTSSVIKRAKAGDVALVGGDLSPGAQFLQEKRTWKGLGSDFVIAYEEDGNGGEGAAGKIEEGRTGIASGYVGEADGEGSTKAAKEGG